MKLKSKLYVLVVCVFLLTVYGCDGFLPTHTPSQSPSLGATDYYTFISTSAVMQYLPENMRAGASAAGADALHASIYGDIDGLRADLGDFIDSTIDYVADNEGNVYDNFDQFISEATFDNYFVMVAARYGKGHTNYFYHNFTASGQVLSVKRSNLIPVTDDMPRGQIDFVLIPRSVLGAGFDWDTPYQWSTENAFTILDDNTLLPE